MREEDCIKIKTEQHYVQLVRTVKGEQEVSVCVGVLCGRRLFTGVCVCMCVVFSYAIFSYMHITSFYFLLVNEQDVPLICCV